MSEESKVYFIGFEEKTFPKAGELLSEFTIVKVNTMEAFEELAETEGTENWRVPLIICGHELADINADEMAQIARMKFPAAMILLITTNREGFNKKILLKNGFDDAFLMPLDQTLVTPKLEIAKSMFDSNAKTVMKAVKLVDVDSTTELDFDVKIRLAKNKKYITHTKGGAAVDEARLSKINESKHTNLFIDAKESEKFFKYSAKVLRNMGKNDALSETEKTEKIQGAIRNLFSEIFADPDSEGTLVAGKNMVQDCQKIVDAYILNEDTPDWYSKFKNAIGPEADAYSHSTRVSTYAAMLSIALNIGKPEELSMAGLFHDLGIAELPPEIQDKDYEEMTAKEKELYHLHPEMSVKLLKLKKVILPLEVYEMILQHHERYDGRGFPKGYTPPKLRKESQLLSLADALDYEMQKMQDNETPDPEVALKKLKENGGWDPELINQAMVVMTPKKES